MHFSHLLLSFLFAVSLVAASPVDRFKLDERQDDEYVIWVTVTSSYTVTVSSTVPQSTTTVTVAAVGDAVQRPAVTTTIEDTDSPAALVTPTTSTTASVDPPAATVDPPATTTTSSGPLAATSTSTDSDTTSSTDSSSDGTLYTGQGTFYETG